MRRRLGRAWWITPALAAVLFASWTPVSVQTPKQEPAKTAPVKDPAQLKLEDIQMRMQKKMEEWATAYNDARSKDEKKKLRASRPGPEFVEELEKLAAEAKGTDVGAASWMEILRIGVDKEKSAVIVDTLLKDYAKSPKLAELPFMMGQFMKPEEASAKLADLVKNSPNKDVQAAALYVSAQPLVESMGDEGDPSPELRTTYDRLRKDYGDLNVPFEGGTYKESVDSFYFKVDNLRIGKVAPDFESIDENGAKFKLSDYRGKVVVVDFWGIW